MRLPYVVLGWTRAAVLLVLVWSGFSGAAAQGAWTTNEQQWPVLPIHMALLPSGHLLILNRSRNDANEQHFGTVLIAPPYDTPGTPIPPPTTDGIVREIFCAGHVLDERGDVVFMGGHAGPTAQFDRHGTGDVWVYRWKSGTWERQHDMPAGRWYPTVIQLPDRSFMVAMGEYCDGPPTDCTIKANGTPDLWTATPGGGISTNHLQPLAPSAMEIYYPHLFIHPGNGRVFHAASGMPGNDLLGQSTLYDPDTCAWEPFAEIPYGFPNVRRAYPSGVMLDGVVYRCGGSQGDGADHDAMARTTRIDLNQANPMWQVLPDMHISRKNHTIVALPDARILVMGGNLRSQSGYATERTDPEILDTEASSATWQLLSGPSGSAAEPRIGRGYHNTSLLLPDGRVVFAGGEREFGALPTWQKQRIAQFYTPEYGGNPNWAQSRPSIVGIPPENIRYGKPFCLDVDVAEGRTLSKLRLISLGATTHGFNQNQQFVTLQFEPHPEIEGRYIVQAPASTFKATPGYFMLFAVDSARIPSVAHILRLQDLQRGFPHTLGIEEASSQNQAEHGQIFLQDNHYLGDAIDSAFGSARLAKISASTTIPSPNPNAVRVSIEMRTSIPTTYTLRLRNWVTTEFDEIASGECLTEDRLRTHLLEVADCPYVSATGEVEAEIEWDSGVDLVPFSLFVDKIEFGVGSFENTAPVLRTLGDRQAFEHEELVIDVVATDVDLPAQELTLTLDPGAPDGMGLSPGGTLSWTPGELDGGESYPVTVRVSDGYTEVAETFVVHVEETNEQPVMHSIPDRVIDEHSTLVFTATATDADLPAQALTFALGPGAPSGAHLTPNGQFSWTPGEADGPKTYLIEVEVDDGAGGKDKTTFEVDVREVNEPPKLAPIGAKHLAEGATLRFAATATDADIPINGLTFSLDPGAPAGASITAQGDFEWTPDPTMPNGPVSLTIRVTDDGTPPMDDFETITVTLEPHVFGAPVDLDGVYLAMAGPGHGFASTSPTGEQVEEVSGGGAAVDGTFTPFSDQHKPASAFLHAMAGEACFFDIDLAGEWNGGLAFIVALHPQSGLGAEVRLTKASDGLRAVLQTSDGAVQVGPAAVFGTDSVSVTLSLDAAGAAILALVPRTGPASGSTIHLGPLPAGLLDPVSIRAGFENSGVSAPSASATLSRFSVTTPGNALALLAPDPFVRPGEAVRYHLYQGNLLQAVGGFQCYLESSGPQSFASGLYSSMPFPASVGGAEYDPIGAHLYLARGIGFNGTPTQANARLATLMLTAGGEGTASLAIRPNNGLGLDTVFGDDGSLGVLIPPNRLHSNVVVVDDTPPLVSDVEVRQGAHDVLATGLVLQGTVEIVATVEDALGGLGTLPTVHFDVAPLGSNSGEDFAIPLRPEVGNRFRALVELPPHALCGPIQIVVVARDRSRNEAKVASQELMVNPTTLALDLQHAQVWAASGPVTRGLEIRLHALDGSVVEIDRNVVFDESGAASVLLDGSSGLPCGTYDEITLKDPLHGLRRRLALSRQDHAHSVSATLAPGDLNDDNRVDIGDYVVLAVRFGNAGPPSTPLPHAPNARHADLDASGEVDIGDYAMISENWFTLGDPAFGSNRPSGSCRDRISVLEAIAESGSTRAKELDRDGDGWITMDELHFEGKRGGRTRLRNPAHPVLFDSRR